jgi:hypothetical protein
MRVRTLLLPALFALAASLIGTVGASAMIGPGITNKAVTNLSPRVLHATHQCRVATKCDKNGKNCSTFDVCR